jgi:hypothetical protein
MVSPNPWLKTLLSSPAPPYPAAMGIRGNIQLRQALLLTTGLSAATAGLWIAGARPAQTATPPARPGTVAIVGLASCLQPEIQAQRAISMLTQVECFGAAQTTPLS